MGLAFSRVFARLFSKREMRILMVRPGVGGRGRAAGGAPAVDAPQGMAPSRAEWGVGGRERAGCA